MKVLPVQDVNFYDICKDLEPCKKNRGGQPKYKKVPAANVVTAFDIETTNIPEIKQNIMYIWQFAFGPDLVIYGRTWDEYRVMLEELAYYMEVFEMKLVVYVHNLSYEFQYLQGIFQFDNDHVFAVDARKVLKCSLYKSRIEFRCSYLLTNMSLDAYTKKMGVQHQKLSGAEFDYTKARYPHTTLSAYEMDYCINDVVGLVESIIAQMERDGDTLDTIPLTSTGYVRRDTKHALRRAVMTIRGIAPDLTVYKLLRAAFRGGNTHANRYYSGIKLLDVHSIDISSSYPTVVCECRYPITKFRQCEISSIDDFRKKSKQNAILCTVTLTGVTLTKTHWGCPYLPKDKCRHVINGLFDNGRILSADSLEITCTDIDLGIILDEYSFESIMFSNCYMSRYGFLPIELRELVLEYYKKKTTLKGIPGQEKYYDLAKALLNSIYGMMAQNPVKPAMLYNANSWDLDESKDDLTLLDEYNKRAFLVYQWGVWVTAHARRRLEDGILIAGENFVYADTDSVKYIGDLDFSALNDKRKEEANKKGLYADDSKGTRHYMGVYEDDGSYSEFATLGAKKYVYRDTRGKLHITIAGVGKIKGADELDKMGGIDAFCNWENEPVVFTGAAGSEAIYNDHPDTTTYTVDGYTYTITPNIYLYPGTYTLGIAADYKRILSEISKFRLTREMAL